MINLKKTNSECSVIILAAGRSKRMGKPKYAMTVAKGRTFLEKIISQYSLFGCKKIVVVLNEEGFINLQKNQVFYDKNTVFIKNIHLNFGRFYSIKLGLKSLDNSFPVFIHNVDNPFVSQEVLHMLLQSKNKDFTVPVFNGKGGHPVLLTQKVVEAILNEDNNDIILSEFLKSLERENIGVEDENILVNINTPEEYQKYFG